MSLRALLVACLLVAAATTASAQSRQHSGFWLGLGAGGGCLDGQRGAAGYLRMGGTPSQRVLFGGEVIGWYREDNGIERDQSSASAVVLFYPYQRNEDDGREPSSVREWFLKGGFGVAERDVDGDVTREGLGLTFGTGFDFRLGRNFYVTPNVDLLMHFFKDQTDTALLVTLGFTWH